MWWKEECDYIVANVLPPLPPLLPFLGAYIGRRGTVGKVSKALRTILSSSSSPLFCLLCLFFFPFLQVQTLGRMSLNVGTACLVSSKSFNAPASEIFCIVEMNHWCM